MLSVRLTDEIEARLDRLSSKTGRSKSWYVKEALQAYLDDLEDFYLAEERMQQFDDAVPLDALIAKHGLED